MKNIKISVQTELITSNDGKNTYEVIKRLEGCEGECAFIISLYPTRNAENISANDSTLNHLVSHFNDLVKNTITKVCLYRKSLLNTIIFRLFLSFSQIQTGVNAYYYRFIWCRFLLRIFHTLFLLSAVNTAQENLRHFV